VDTAWVNVFHLRTTGATTATPLVDWISILDQFASAYLNTVLEDVSSGCELLDATGTLILSSTEQLHASVPVSSFGDDGADAVGAAPSAVISWATRGGWRGGRPRTYMPGLTINSFDTVGRLSDSFVSTLKNSAETFLANANDMSHGDIATCELGFMHSQLHDVWLDPAVFFPFIGVQVHPFPRTQRRRASLDD